MGKTGIKNKACMGSNVCNLLLNYWQEIKWQTSKQEFIMKRNQGGWETDWEMHEKLHEAYITYMFSGKFWKDQEGISC